MTAWDTGAFQNDSALDLLAELDDLTARQIPTALFEVFATADADYLDENDGSRIVAAAHLIGFQLGELPVAVEATDLLADSPFVVTRTLRDAAADALERVLDQDSEWRELWEETEDYPTVSSSVETLRVRLVSLD